MRARMGAIFNRGRKPSSPLPAKSPVTPVTPVTGGRERPESPGNPGKIGYGFGTGATRNRETETRNRADGGAKPVTGRHDGYGLDGTRLRVKSPELRGLRALRVANAGVEGFATKTPSAPVASDAETAFDERAGMAGDSVPAVYLDAWARLNCRRPDGVTEGAWRLALDDGGRFLDAWGDVAADWGWTPGELFDVPRADRPGGLTWRIGGRAIVAFSPDGAWVEGDEWLARTAHN